ncbi:DUF6580 family putative transport protein [Acidipila rosea]|uniref:Uncharacterized protein n=1 Tax=Acidipila rosea TaxID=768535 RepID=A0A4R1KZ79_9BACT|nr:DUF6580 family putative transport protein [Acidipila rosea]TCK70856.1 hypothetical protein C7378_3245 [Acidipila rosea]
MSAYLLILAAVFSRIMPHSWLNFTAVGGGLLFFGGRRPLRQAWIPVLLMAATDYYLTTFAYGYSFHAQDYLLTWTWYAAVVILGHLMLRGRPSPARVGGAVLLASTSFFAISNYAVWIGSLLYPHTLSGLATCYAAALPFYRNDLLSTALVAGLAYGLPEAASRLAAQRSVRSAA